jgi:predicted negative regulator of RcsB-dependent stress response
MAEGIIPTNAAIAFELGKVLLENKKFDEALTRFTTAAAHGHGSLAHSASRQAATIAAWQRSQLATVREADAGKK